VTSRCWPGIVARPVAKTAIAVRGLRAAFGGPEARNRIGVVTTPPGPFATARPVIRKPSQIRLDRELRRVQRERPRPGPPPAVGDDPPEQRGGDSAPAPAPRDEEPEHVPVVARRADADDPTVDLGHEIALPLADALALGPRGHASEEMRGRARGLIRQHILPRRAPDQHADRSGVGFGGKSDAKAGRHRPHQTIRVAARQSPPRTLV